MNDEGLPPRGHNLGKGVFLFHEQTDFQCNIGHGIFEFTPKTRKLREA
jgi:hypothetical protein